VKISDVEKWQLIQWKSLEAAYRTSPFFEFYEDEIQPLFELKSDFIFDHNVKCFEVISGFLQLDITPKFTTTFNKNPEDLKDFRPLANARQEKKILLEPYTQVFNSKHGYINNLSILDLLFNEGTNALSYLESQLLPDV
ncbi:MAG: WbqC family protein, partial [Olleya sp.]